MRMHLNDWIMLINRSSADLKMATVQDSRVSKIVIAIARFHNELILDTDVR